MHTDSMKASDEALARATEEAAAAKENEEAAREQKAIAVEAENEVSNSLTIANSVLFTLT